MFLRPEPQWNTVVAFVCVPTIVGQTRKEPSKEKDSKNTKQISDEVSDVQ